MTASPRAGGSSTESTVERIRMDEATPASVTTRALIRQTAVEGPAKTGRHAQDASPTQAGGHDRRSPAAGGSRVGIGTSGFDRVKQHDQRRLAAVDARFADGAHLETGARECLQMLGQRMGEIRQLDL